MNTTNIQNVAYKQHLYLLLYADNIFILCCLRSTPFFPLQQPCQVADSLVVWSQAKLYGNKKISIEEFNTRLCALFSWIKKDGKAAISLGKKREVNISIPESHEKAKRTLDILKGKAFAEFGNDFQITEEELLDGLARDEYAVDVPHVPDILDRIPINDQKIGKLSGLDTAQPPLCPEIAGITQRAADDDIHRIHSRPDQQLHLVLIIPPRICMHDPRM